MENIKTVKKWNASGASTRVRSMLLEFLSIVVGGETLVNVFLGAFSTKFAFFSLPSKQSSVYVF